MKRLFSKVRGSTLDFALAGFAGAAFTFAAFFLPEWRLTQIALASGLADIFPPARPPLGFTARALFALGMGFVACAGSLLLLRLAERKPVKRAVTEADAAPEPIRLRRADAHPDAPARRPLVARDLGEPEGEWLLAPEAEVPAFPVEQEPETVEVEPIEAEGEAGAPLVRPAEAPVQPEPQAAEPVAAEPEPQPQPEPQPAASAPPPRAAPEAEPSISGLMQRLEFGLAKKERAVLSPQAVSPPSDDAVGHRLRSAIGDLQKLAARG
jgi:hypothetical protein